MEERVMIRRTTEMLTAKWCKKDFLPMSQGFRVGRARSDNKMDKCFWCGHEFIDGEMMALACFKEKGNKVLCQGCASPLVAPPEE